MFYFFGRKRSRALFDEDSLEFMPLSKRINNLHINSISGNISHLSNGLPHPQINQEWGPGPPPPHHQMHLIPQQIDEQSQQLEYQPELSLRENPFYYTTNKLLFDLYVERVNRHNNGGQF